MRFRRLKMRGVSFVACNGLAHCLFDDCHGEVTKKGFEFARYSHSTKVIDSSLRGHPESQVVNMQMYVPECSHRCTFDNVDVDVRGFGMQSIDTSDLPRTYGVSGFTSGSRYNVLKNSRQLSDKHSKAFSITGTDDRPTIGNRIENCEIVGDSADIVVRVLTPGVKAGHHVIVDSEISGAGATDGVLLVGGTNDCEVTNNVIPQGVKDFGLRNTLTGNTRV